jgi:malonate transporter and related proteins
MSWLVLHKLAAIFATVALGWIAGRRRWLAADGNGGDPARMLGRLAFTIFVPALLFRTSARLDLHAMPVATMAAFFVPALLMLALVYLTQRWRQRGVPAADMRSAEALAARPAARAIAVVFGNSVQVGIPLTLALFGEAGLGLFVALVSLHALVLLSVPTVLVELDLARARARHDATAGLLRTLGATVHNTVIHPVVLPVLAGLAWNAGGVPLPAVVDETLQLLGSAVAPLCLVLIGLSLTGGGPRGAWRGAVVIALLKLLLMPALVLGVAHWGFGLAGLPLSVVVVMAALPTGANPLIFAQRYQSNEAETATAVVLSTLAFALTLPLWLAALAAMPAAG